ncbi:MAG: hypothetical protein AAB842_02625 [Patescibacteria group bacterium]
MKLSLKKYGWKCALGSEIIYFICLLGGLLLLPLRNARGAELHRAIFEILPGFTWITVESVALGAIYFFIFAWIFAWYFVWMHNSSMIESGK